MPKYGYVEHDGGATHLSVMKHAGSTTTTTTTVSTSEETTTSQSLADTINALFAGDENPMVRFINYFVKKLAEFLAEMKSAMGGFDLGFLRGLFQGEN